MPLLRAAGTTWPAFPTLAGVIGGTDAAAGANNLPAAAAVVAGSRPSMWAAVRGLAIGPNLLLPGSVASMITRRIARDHGVRLGVVGFSLVGAVVLPLQLLVGLIGLHVTGAL